MYVVVLVGWVGALATLQLLDVVSVAEVDAEKRFDDSLVEILKLKFGDDVKAFVWLRCWSWSKLLITTLRLIFGQYFVDDFWLELRGWSFVEILWQNF